MCERCGRYPKIVSPDRAPMCGESCPNIRVRAGNGLGDRNRLKLGK